MKTICVYLLCILGITKVFCQDGMNEVTTVVLKTPDLITHVAENYPADEPQQLILLIETDNEHIPTDQRFFLEQSVKLLLKRLGEEDKIAIATYGYDNQVVMDFVAGDQVGYILEKLTLLSKERTLVRSKDGIDQGYQLADQFYAADKENVLIMLRNNKIETYETNTELSAATEKKSKKDQLVTSKTKLGGAIALTALTMLPEILEIIKD